MAEKDATLESVLSRLDEYNSRTIFVSHLPRVCTLKQLMALFKKSVNARFSIGKPTGSSKFGFVEFKSSSEAKRAKTASESLTITGKPVRVEICSERIVQKGSDGDKCWCPPHSRTLSDFNLTTLHVSCLPKDATLADLSPLFPKSRKITLPSEGPDKCLGRALVTFATPEDALEAFNSTHGRLVHKCPIVVNFKLRASTKKKAAPVPVADEKKKNNKKRKNRKNKKNKKHAPKTGKLPEALPPPIGGKKGTPSKPVSAVLAPSACPKLKEFTLVTDTPVTKKRKRPLSLSSPTDASPPKAALKSAHPEDTSSSHLTPPVSATRMKPSGSAKKKRRSSAVIPPKVAAIW
ncbi:unnamed protein product [Schistocephalus solidus]|uniref:RRM domain-containing protein n=1 Tax=Schistocephalus solidus TaxID=70667 RepID=A0A183T6P9_SCHSO|nr:unnamed protein product [Schistocephalus solidus]